MIVFSRYLWCLLCINLPSPAIPVFFWASSQSLCSFVLYLWNTAGVLIFECIFNSAVELPRDLISSFIIFLLQLLKLQNSNNAYYFLNGFDILTWKATKCQTLLQNAINASKEPSTSTRQKATNVCARVPELKEFPETAEHFWKC